VYRVNGPAPGWFARSKVDGHVTMHLGTTMNKVESNGDRVHLQFSQRDGTAKDLHVDHVIAATGYQVKLDRLNFFHRDLQSQIKTANGAPILSTNFESSVPGLYLVGLASASSFGPLCRFAYGAKFTAPRIARHLATST
jgi:thioredoxin reductase